MTPAKKTPGLLDNIRSFLVSRLFLIAALGLVAAGVITFWCVGLAPLGGTLAAGPAPVANPPPWVERLGMKGLTVRRSPEPDFQAKLTRLEFEEPKAKLIADLCSGRGMKPDKTFREIRQALVQADRSLCTGVERRLAIAPLIVGFGAWVGGVVSIALIILVIGASLILLDQMFFLHREAVLRDWPIYRNANKRNDDKKG
jgi:hypothetical protein